MILCLWILVQIIAESLPISSSGHVQLLQKLYANFNWSQAGLEQPWVIDFLLHGPTIIILLVYFFSTWWMLIMRQPFSWRALLQIKTYEEIIRPLFFVFVADLITFGFWIIDFNQFLWIQHYFLTLGFCCTAVCLYFSKSNNAEKLVSWKVQDAVILGIVQGLSLLPGISRFASTYAAGVWLGYNRMSSFALSFMIQFPLLCACFVKASKALLSMSDVAWSNSIYLILGLVIIASLISFRLFCWVAILIRQNRLWYFAYYMIIPIVISLGL